MEGTNGRAAFRAWVLAAGVAAVAGASGAQNLVTNGGFEVPVISVSNTTVAAGSSALTGWTISGTSGIDLVRGLWQPAEGAQSISLNWTSPSTIAQLIGTQAGAKYALTFAMAAENPATVNLVRTMDVVWAGGLVAGTVFSPTGHTNAAMGWETHEFIVTGSGSDLLQFRSTTTGNPAYGPALDAVSLRVVLGIDAQPDAETGCATGSGTFSIVAGGDGPFEYQWQIERAADSWVALSGEPVSLACGGVAVAGSPEESSTTVGVRGCTGVFGIRCIVSNEFGALSSRTVTLTVCAPDFDCDGFVTGADFDLYVQAFESGDMAADFDGDGFITGVDFDSYVVAFEEGC